MTNQRVIAVAAGVAVAALAAIAIITTRDDGGRTRSSAGGWATDAEPKAIGTGATSNLTVATDANGSQIVVAWYAQTDVGSSVMITTSTDHGDTFSQPITLGSNLEGPKAFVLNDGAIMVSAFASDGSASAGWPVFYRSDDGGASFTKTIDLREVVGEQTDRSTLPSAAISSDGQRIIIGWHDHQHHDASHSSAPVQAITSLDGGHTWTDPKLVAPQSCHCCPLSAFVLGDQLGVGFRDQLDVDAANDERDPAFVIADGSGVFGDLQELHDDQWVMEREGCPASGPRLSATGDEVHAVWWTGANNEWHFLYTRGTPGGDFAEPQTLEGPGGDGDAIDAGNFTLATDAKGTAWVMSAVFPVNATGYETLVWRIPAGGTPTAMKSLAHPHGLAQAGYDLAAVDGGAVMAFRDADNDTVLLQRVAA